ncbi:MAG: helix-turn-helix domain-containing protein [Deltaproteobacteria bacterium]|nr:helix-turn-helix domain-containing protein [Deltaproteobacteria bacterium]
MKSSAATMNYEPVLTVREVAGIFKLSSAAVRHLIQKGEIAAIRIGKQFRVPQSAIDDYFKPFQQPHPLPGFGLLKGRKFPKGVVFENQVRKRSKHQSLRSLLRQLEKIK